MDIIETASAPANGDFSVPFSNAALVLAMLQITVPALKGEFAALKSAVSNQATETSARLEADETEIANVGIFLRLVMTKLGVRPDFAQDPDTGETRPVLVDIPSADKGGKSPDQVRGGAGGPGKAVDKGGPPVANPADAVPGRTGAFDFARRPPGRRRLI